MKSQFNTLLSIFTLVSLSISVSGQKYDQVPSVKFIDIKGNEVKNSDLKTKPGMFMYFDPLCDVCRIEMKIIKSHLKYFQDKAIIMVSPGKKDDIEQFVKKHGLDKIGNITIIHDVNDDFYKKFKTNGYPSIFIYNINNEITATFAGETLFEEIRNGFEMPTNLVTNELVAVPINGN